MSQVAVSTTVRASTNAVVIHRLMEAGWLVAVGLIPLVVFHDQWMVGFIQMPKVFLLRTVALGMVVLLAFEWAVARSTPPSAPASPDDRVGWRRELASPRVRRALSEHPARFIAYGAAAVLVANLVSLAFSPVKSIGVSGVDPGWDTYGLYSVASYVVIFAVVATHLRTQDQVRRLLWTLTVTSVLVSLYGVGQHFGVDWFRSDSPPVARAPLTFGNPIFAASYLVMTVPLTIALAMPWARWMSPFQHVMAGAGLLFIPFAAVLFTLSRGPWIGMIAMGLALLAIAARVLSRPVAVRMLVILWVALAGGLLLTVIPVSGVQGDGDTVADRLASSVPGVATGLDSRLSIWRTSLDTLFSVHWVDTDEFPEIPELGVEPLRPLVGYGPDMFQYAFPTAGSTEFTSTLASHGHSFIVHSGLELGLIGVAAYGLLFGAVAYALLRMLRSVRAGAYPEWLGFVVVGLSAALVGRFIEQIPGKAQVSDLTLSWVLAGLVFALTTMRFEQDAAVVRAGPRRRRERPRTRVAAAGQVSVVKVAAASAVAVLVAVFWFQAVVVHFASAFDAADAGQALSRGQFAQAQRDFASAIDLAPSNTINHLQLAQAYFLESDAADPDVRRGLLGQAIREAEVVLDRNPLDHRAWSRLGEFNRELGVIDGGDPVAAARPSLVLANLMPGFWQARLALSWAYVRVGLFDDALTAITDTKALGAAARTSELVFYVEALALRGLGRNEEAIAAAQHSMELRPNRQAEEVLRSLGAL